MYKPKIPTSRSAYRFLTVLLWWPLIAGLIAGCGESPGNSAQKQSNESVEKAGQLIWKSQYDLADAGAAQYDLQADREAFRQSLKEWNQLAQGLDPKNDQMLLKVCDQISAISQQLLELHRKIDVPIVQWKNDHLQQAQQTLSQAISQARQAGAREAQVGPELMLGTLYLMEARDKAHQLNQQAVIIHRAQVVLSGLLSTLAQEELVGYAWQSRQPQELITKLNARLDEPTLGLRSQLAQAEAKTEKILAQRNDLQQKFESGRDQAETRQREYVDMLNQAEQAQGRQRYQLQLKAYDLQRGFGQGPDKVIGVIALEAQAQHLENELNVLDTNLQYQLLWQGKLRENIKQVENDIKLLQDSTILDDIKTGLAQSDQRKEQLVILLSNRLSELQAADKQYAALRTEAVEFFSKTLASFEQAAASVAPGSRNTRQHAQNLARLAGKEQVQLWRNDAAHYDLSQSILASAQKVAELSDMAGQMRIAYEQAYTQAQSNADQLLQQLPEEVVEEEPFPPYGEPEPVDIVDTTTTVPIISDPNRIGDTSTTAPIISDPNLVISDPNRIVR